MLQVIGKAAALVGAHRYSNTNAVLVGAVELNAFTGIVVGTSEGTAKKVNRQKKRHTRKKVTKGAKANTRRQESNRWTIQLNSKSVSD